MTKHSFTLYQANRTQVGCTTLLAGNNQFRRVGGKEVQPGAVNHNFSDQLASDMRSWDTVITALCKHLMLLNQRERAKHRAKHGYRAPLTEMCRVRAWPQATLQPPAGCLGLGSLRPPTAASINCGLHNSATASQVGVLLWPLYSLERGPCKQPMRFYEERG